MDPTQALDINRAGWDKLAAGFGGTILPRYGPLSPSDAELHLIEPLQGARVLDLGCGSGKSLLYLAQQGAGELWGLDLSHAQIERTAALLREHGIACRLFESPMEENPGIPLAYFDFVVSIYSLGWTVNLCQTLRHVHSYLKDGGCFIFSWEHPVFGCLAYDGEQYVFKHSYHQEGPVYRESWKGVPVVMQRRKLDTYINGLIDTGFVVERLVESPVDTTVTHEHNLDPQYWYALQRAELMPTTLIVKVRKPSRGPVSDGASPEQG